MDFYSRTVNFGISFEVFISRDLADLLPRIGDTNNEVWVAVRSGIILGTIFIDGQGLDENKAHLRAFVVDETVSGVGIGKKLLEKAIDFVEDRRGF
jgi:GNAT superfamily N-acetyltransferase